jgi:hypothetical protein
MNNSLLSYFSFKELIVSANGGLSSIEQLRASRIAAG